MHLYFCLDSNQEESSLSLIENGYPCTTQLKNQSEFLFEKEEKKRYRKNRTNRKNRKNRNEISRGVNNSFCKQCIQFESSASDAKKKPVDHGSVDACTFTVFVGLYSNWLRQL